VIARVKPGFCPKLEEEEEERRKRRKRRRRRSF